MADTDSDSAESAQQLDSDGESPVGYTVGIVNNSSDTEQGTPHFWDEDEGSDHVVHSHHYPPPRTYDMTSPPNHGAMLHPITVDDTPLRPLGAPRHHESVDLTTPRAAITANITRLTTVERDYELARKLQEEENEDGDRNETRAAVLITASPTAADADYALAMQLYQTEIEETERTRAEQQRQHLLQLQQQQQQHLQQQQQQQLQQQLRLQQQRIRYPGRGGFMQATNEDDEDDGYGYDHDHNHDDDDGDGDENGIPEYPRGILVRRHMGRHAPIDRRHMPANAQLRALMTREIDPNDYDTLLRLDEQTQQKASNKSSKETEQLIRGLPRYTWPDKDSASSDSKKRKKPTRQLSITGNTTNTTNSSSRKRGRRGGDDDNVESSSSSLTRLPSVVAVGPTAASSQDVTNAITTTTPQQQQQEEEKEPETCPICLEQFRDGQVICILPCESLHNFHDTCIEHWLRVKAECPIDKSRLL